jgi:hypothetical protein
VPSSLRASKCGLGLIRSSQERESGAAPET